MFGVLLALPFLAQNLEPYEFKDYKRLEATPVKNQGRTGTCWSFSTTSFLESELIRMGKGAHDLSEMFTVRNIYRQKCENYVRRLGKAQLSEGGLAHDNLNAVAQYGVVPESVYPGRKDPSKLLNHSKIINVLEEKCNEMVKLAEKGELPRTWLSEIDALLDEEFGVVPITFTYNNIQFTPTSFRDYLGLNPKEYVTITSFTHHPFWTEFILEIPDNFSNGQYYNMPLGDMMRCLNHSIQQGYTVEWDADASNPGFGARSYGLAIVPEADWSTKSREAIANTFSYWEPERVVTQDYRQEQFDRGITQDDHLMHITGILNETNGGIYYAVKNSWGDISDRNGYVYVSEAYMRLNTLSFTVHKQALPKPIRQRMGLEPGAPAPQTDQPGGGATGATSGDDSAAPIPTKSRANNTTTRARMRDPNMKVMPAKQAPTSKE